MEISLSDLLSKSWNSFKAQWVIAVGLTLALLAVNLLLGRLTIAAAVITYPLQIGWIYCMAKISQGEKPEFEDLIWPFKNVERFGHALVVSVLYLLGCLIGTVLLIIPGIWFMVAGSLSGTFFALGETHCIRAIERSMRAVKDRWWRTAGALLICAGLALLGTLCLGVGIVAAIPVIGIFMINYARAIDRGAVPKAS